MNLKAKLQNLLYRDSAIELASSAKHFRLTETEEDMLATLAQIYSMKEGRIMRRLIRQAAIEYTNDGEVIGLLRHNNSEVE